MLAFKSEEIKNPVSCEVEIPKSRINLFRFEWTITANEYQYSRMNVTSGIYWSHCPESPGRLTINI
jgi:hypothetical protein